MLVRLLFVGVVISFTCNGAGGKTSFSSKDYAFKRIFAKAKSDPKWGTAKTLTDRIWLVRSYSAKYSVVSDPVSDRYMITCYGGPIDLVHFFGLAAPICSGNHGLAKRLYREWVAEGGQENLFRFNHESPPHATPDDLPSNALGALFGLEIRKHNEDLMFDIEKAFENFVRALIPVKDQISREFSHHQIIMGYPLNPSRALKNERNAYFTAEPLIQCNELNIVSRRLEGRDLCQPARDGIDALEKAGFRLLSYKDRPIIIRRSDSK